MKRTAWMVLTLSMSLLLPIYEASAEPPHWAPAHGHRAKHERKYERRYDRHRSHRRSHDRDYSYRDDHDSDGGHHYKHRRHRRYDSHRHYPRVGRRVVERRWEESRAQPWRDEEWAPYDNWRRAHRPREIAILDGRCQGERGYNPTNNGAQLGNLINAMQGGDLTSLAVLGLQEYLLGRSAPGLTVARSDHYCFGQALEYARDGRDVVWDNPDVGSSYRIAASKPFRRAGRFCRDYTSRIAERSGKTIVEQGIACRGEDGLWQALN